MFVSEPNPGKGSKITKGLRMVLPFLLESCRVRSRFPLSIELKCSSQSYYSHFKSGSCNSYLAFHGCTFPGCCRNILKMILLFVICYYIHIVQNSKDSKEQIMPKTCPSFPLPVSWTACSSP